MDVPCALFGDNDQDNVGPSRSIEDNLEQLEMMPMPINGLSSDVDHAKVENGGLGIDQGIPEFWDKMDPGTPNLEITLYGNARCNPLYERECQEVICRVFKAPALSGSHEMVAYILNQANYKLVSIRRCQNKKRWKMHTFFQENYEIAQHEVSELYHGTTKDNAKNIKETGFRSAACRRAKFGRGIYGAKNVWEALAYSEPDAEKEQRFFVVRMCVGTSRIGEAHMVNFGKDGFDRQIVTTTNATQSYFCAAFEDQVYAQYEVTVRYALENAPNDSVHRYVGTYHRAVRDWIRDQIKPSRTLEDTDKAVLPPLSAATNECQYLKELDGHVVGEEVVLKNLKGGCATFNNAMGRIKEIARQDKICWLAVEMNMRLLRDTAIRIHKMHIESMSKTLCANGWIRCSLDQVEGRSVEVRVGVKGYKIGDRVKLDNMFSDWIPFNGEYGAIRQISMIEHTDYFVELERADLQDLAKSILQTGHQDPVWQGNPFWVRCKHLQLEHAPLNTEGGDNASTSQNSTVEAARAGKRKKMDLDLDE